MPWAIGYIQKEVFLKVLSYWKMIENLAPGARTCKQGLIRRVRGLGPKGRLGFQISGCSIKLTWP